LASQSAVTSQRAAAPRLSDAQLVEVLDLIKGADSVELKLTVPEADQRSAVAALEMDPLEAQIRQVWFLDTPDLLLNRSGLVVRVRRSQRKADDSVVKLRPIAPDALPEELRSAPGFGVEVDAMPGGFVCSGSMKGEVEKDGIRQAVAGKLEPHRLFTKEQRALFSDRAPEGAALDGLSLLGSIFVLKLKFSPLGYDRRLVAELWLYPDGTRVLELSTKCAPGEAFQVAAETRAFLTDRGLDLGGEQEAKTSKALRFFARELTQA
jgi:hypothetical protein